MSTLPNIKFLEDSELGEMSISELKQAILLFDQHLSEQIKRYKKIEKNEPSNLNYRILNERKILISNIRKMIERTKMFLNSRKMDIVRTKDREIIVAHR